MTAGHFEITEHTADIGIRVSGANREAVFDAAARGMLACLGDLCPQSGCEGAIVRVEVEAPHEAELLRDWLAELLFHVESRRATITTIRFDRLDAGHLDAKVTLVPYDEALSGFRNELKAVTYHRLRFEQVGGRFEAEIIFDI